MNDAAVFVGQVRADDISGGAVNQIPVVDVLGAVQIQPVDDGSLLVIAFVELVNQKQQRE